MKTTVSSKKRKLCALPDIFILGLILLCTVLGFILLFLPKGEGEIFAEIKIHGEIFKTVSLSNIEKPYEISVSGDLPVIIEVTNGGICFKESKCPDKLCVNRGVIRKNGESAVCLPAAVSIKIVAENSSASVDAEMG